MGLFFDPSSRFAVVDLEATGGNDNQIIEVGIIIFEAGRVLEKFTSFVRPTRSIPDRIKKLTGISGPMVENAPYFYELASTIDSMTQKAIFVAHNRDFDYPLLKEEMELVGITYKRETLCTFELAKQLLPSVRSYKLGDLCSLFRIPQTKHHRALDDAMATTFLLNQLITLLPKIRPQLSHIKAWPTLLPKKIIEEVECRIPSKAGIFFCLNKDNKILYVGQGESLKEAVADFLQNGCDNSGQPLDSRDFDHLQFELTTYSVERLFLHDYYVQKYIGREQEQWGIYSYYNRQGLIQLKLSLVDHNRSPLFYVRDRQEGERILEQFTFAKEILPIQKSSLLQSYRKWYNQKINDSLSSYIYPFPSFVLLLEMDSRDECFYILVHKFQLKGIGYVRKNRLSFHLSDFFKGLKRLKEFYYNKNWLLQLIKSLPKNRNQYFLLKELTN